jgi:hypothetical protein
MKYFFLAILVLAVIQIAVQWAWLVHGGHAIMVLEKARPYRAGTLKKETTCHYFTGTGFFTVRLKDEVHGVRCQPVLKTP